MRAQGSADPVASSEAGMTLQDYSRLRQWGQAFYSLTDYSLDAAALGRRCGIRPGRFLQWRVISGDSDSTACSWGISAQGQSRGHSEAFPAPHRAEHILCL